ncbi:MAG: fibrobacter succinogenes major paralogous domain-containing protein [Bacteroidales bacterium]
MNIKANSRLYFSFLILGILLFFGSCDQNDNNDNGNGPASFEMISVDYITGGSAFFAADIMGDMAKVDAMGFCWGRLPDPGMEDTCNEMTVLPGPFSFRVENLSGQGPWYVRAWYVSGGNYFYSPSRTFQLTNPVTDSQGNLYPTLQIGNQIWMGENLRTYLYNNGNNILSGTGMGNYSAMPAPAYWFWYNDLEANADSLGLLYTWFVITDERGICPAGFRVPDILDWENMIVHLDALANRVGSLDESNRELSAIVGGMLKTRGNTQDGNSLWEPPNGGATNITGMSVEPSGLRDPTGAFDGKGYNAAFWSVTEENSKDAVMFYTHFFNGGIYANYFNKKSGYAVRCMKQASP